MSKYQILHKTETHSAEWCLIEVPTTTNSNKGGACCKQYAVFIKKLVSLPFIWEKQTGMSTLWPLAEMNSTCAVMRMNSMIFRMQQSSSVNPKNIYIHKCRNNYTGNPWHIYETVVDWIIFPPEQDKTCTGYIPDSFAGGNWAVPDIHVIGTLYVLYAFRTIQYFRRRISIFSKSGQISNLHRLIKNGALLEAVLKLVG